MRSIFDTKDFLALENEEKIKLLELEKQKFDDVNLEEELESLKQKEASIHADMAKLQDKIISYGNQSQNGDNFSDALAAVSAELEKLNQISGQMRQKSLELDKHKNALELKTMICRKNDLSNEIEDLKKQLEEMISDKRERENALVEIRSNYDTFYESFNEEMARLMCEDEKQKFQACAGEMEDETLEKFKIQEKINYLNDEKITLEEEIQRISEKCEAVDNDILELQDKLSEMSIPEEKKELIVQAKDLESEIIIYDEMLKRVGELLDSNKNELKTAKEKYSTELAVERKIQDDLSKIQESTSKVFGASELSEFQKLRNCDKSLCSIAQVENELQIVDQNIERSKAKITSYKQNIENLKAEIEKQKTIYEQKLAYSKSIKQNLERLQETREELLGSNCLGMITQYTNIGDSCPICRTRVSQKNHIEVIDLVGIEKEIEMAKNKLGFAEKDLNNTYSVMTSLQSLIDYIQTIIDAELKEIQNFESSKIKIYQKVVDINNNTVENFENLKNALTKTSSALENVISLKEKLDESIKDNANNKIEYGTRISMLSELDEQLIDLYYVLQKERAERELMMLEAKASVSENDFDQKRSEYGQNDLQIQALMNELMALYSQSSELKAKMFVAREKLSDIQYERGVYEAKQHSVGEIKQGEMSNISFESPIEKMNELQSSHKNLLALKDSAENSFANLVKEYEVKTKLLSYKIEEYQDLSALVSSMVYRYNFAGEDEVREYIITDNMLKLKDAELKNYYSAFSKLEVQKEFLSVQSTGQHGDISGLMLEKQELATKLGEVKVEILQKEQEIAEYNKIVELMKRFS